MTGDNQRMDGTESQDRPVGGGLNRRDALKAAGGSAIALALAGCADLLGGDDDEEAVAGDIPDEDIEAGLQTFTEGPASVLGVQAQYGAEEAVRRINDNGGIAGREMNLEVVHEDGSWAENYNRWVDEGKDVTFGPISSGGHLDLVGEVEAAGVVNVATDGTVTTLFEEEIDDPTYSFRFQNHDVMEASSAAITAVEQLGAENIDTYANINPDYAFGQDEREIFNETIEALTGAEEVYNGFPELATDDMSTHVTAVVSEEPDVLFSSCWGGDATLLLSQGQDQGMPDATDIIVGPVFYGSANDFSQGDIQGNIWSGSRNFYWGFPPTNRWDPGQELFDAAQDAEDTIPTAHYMSGYGAVTAWATAVEKAIDMLGGWPEQEQIANALEGHGFFTPAGYHTMATDHQCYSSAHFGRLEWSDDIDGPVLEDVSVRDPREVSPPPGRISREWIAGW